MSFIEILKAIVQGIVQGITEWLPISSTGHILLLDAVWKMDASDAFKNVFKVVIQLGSIMAVVVLYFHKLNPFSPKKEAGEKKATWVLWSKVLVASIPAAIAGLLLDDLIDSKLSTPWVIAAALIVYGIAFILMERMTGGAHALRTDRLEDISYGKALGIGAFQMLALIPGTSRSGSTILGATLLGVSRSVAAEFSFFMAIPVMLGASGLKLVKYLLSGEARFTAQEWVMLAVATVVAFVVSLIVIRGLMAFIKKHSFAAFGWYRIALGAVVLLVMWLAPNALK